MHKIVDKGIEHLFCGTVILISMILIACCVMGWLAKWCGVGVYIMDVKGHHLTGFVVSIFGAFFVPSIFITISDNRNSKKPKEP